jgi:hypothetical protein
MLHRTISKNMICRTLCGLMLVIQAHAADSTTVRATVVLGLEGASKNTSGELSIQNDGIVFRQSQGSTNRISIASVREAFLGQEDKEVGGTTMAVGRAATPFGGGRVIGMFAHKKFDFLALTYVDLNGGVHGAIFQLTKGQGQVFEKELESRGVQTVQMGVDAAKQQKGTGNEKK